MAGAIAGNISREATQPSGNLLVEAMRGGDAQVHYTNGYHDYVDPLSRHVRPWTTVDTQFSWRLSSGIKLSLTATNLFNVTPPFINYSAGLGFDPEEGSDLGRVVGLDMSWIW